MYKFITSIAVILIFSPPLLSQMLNNKGGSLTITPNIIITVDGGIQNADNGTIDNQGTISLTGDWTNNAANPVFINNTGTVKFKGDNQNINGNPTEFSTLDLSQGTGTVTLQTNTTVSEILQMDNRVLNLNEQTLTIDNPTFTAISTNDGKILSESENSQVQWNTGANIGDYMIPFGTIDGAPIPLSVNISQAGSGSIIASTYPTADNNTPLPNGIGDMNFNGNEVSNQTIDRFWLLELNGATANTTFTYEPTDLTGNTVNENNLVLLHHDGTTWQNTNSGSFNGVGSHSFTGVLAVSGAFALFSSTPTVAVQIKLFLEGSYDMNSGAMTTDLRTANLLPLTQPFNRAPWQYFGNEQFSNLNDIPSNAVDWVFVELRDVVDNSIVVAEKAAILLQDGNIQDVNGTNGVTFTVPNGNYFISIKTRNHLATLSINAPNLPNIAPYDFSDVSQVEGGAGQLVEVATGIYAQAGGDFDSDGIVTVADFNLYNSQASFLNVYVDGDGTMDKAVTIADFNIYQSNASRIGVTQIRY